MGCINRMPWLFPGYLDFTTTAPVVPKLYWDVASQEQRWLRICEQLGKVICYADCMGKQLNVTMKDVEDLQNEFEEFKESGFFDYYAEQLEKWIQDNAAFLFTTLAKQVFFGLTMDGHFVAYIPDGWEDITFDTGAVYGRSDYGRLILRFTADGAIDNTYDYSYSDAQTLELQQAISDLETIIGRDDLCYDALFTNLDEEV